VLPQVLGHAEVVAKSPLWTSGLISADEWMRARRDARPPFGGIALMGDPDLGAHVVKP